MAKPRQRNQLTGEQHARQGVRLPFAEVGRSDHHDGSLLREQKHQAARVDCSLIITSGA
jgi:hypothetical protein